MELMDAWLINLLFDGGHDYSIRSGSINQEEIFFGERNIF